MPALRTTRRPYMYHFCRQNKVVGIFSVHKIENLWQKIVPASGTSVSTSVPCAARVCIHSTSRSGALDSEAMESFCEARLFLWQLRPWWGLRTLAFRQEARLPADALTSEQAYSFVRLEGVWRSMLGAPSSHEVGVAGRAEPFFSRLCCGARTHHTFQDVQRNMSAPTLVAWSRAPPWQT